MTRAFWLGLAAASVAFAVLLLLAARISDAATDTIDDSNLAWLVSCAIAGLIAGFLGARLARAAPPGARYAAGIAGPGLLALLFALTTNAAEASGPWLALAASVAAAALGSFLGAAQRRR